MTQSQRKLITTRFWYRIGEAVEPAQLDLYEPKLLDDSSGYACDIRWTIEGKKQDRKAFGADRWKAVLTGLGKLYWEVESLQLTRQAQLYWTESDAEQQVDPVEASSLFGGLQPGPIMSQQKEVAQPAVQRFQIVWNDALRWLDDSSKQNYQDLSASIARLLEEIVTPSRVWEPGRWFDAVLIGGAKQEDDTLELVGTAIWGVRKKSAQFVSPVRLKFTEPPSEGAFEWQVLLSNPDPPAPYSQARQVYRFESREPEWHLEIFHDPEGTF
jgi:hypothetical protein